MNDDFKESLDKLLNYEVLDYSNVNGFEKEYNETIRMSKLKNLIENIPINTTHNETIITASKEIEESSLDNNIFFKELRSNVKPPEDQDNK